MKKTTECSFVHDVNIIRKQDKFTISVYRKPTFGGIYTYFDSFLPSAYRISMFHTLLHIYISRFTQIGLSFTYNWLG